MFAEQPKFKKWVSLLVIAGFGAFILYLYFFTSFTNVVGTLGKTNPYIYVFAFLTVLGGAVFNALTWHSILGNLSVQTTFRRVFNLSWVGIFVDALIPGGWSGDIFKTYLLSKDIGVDGAKAAAAIVVKNVLELLVTLGASVAGMIMLAFSYSLDATVTIAIGVTMFLLALPIMLIVYLSTNIKATNKMLSWLNRFLAFIKRKPSNSNPDGTSKIQASLNEFRDGIMSMKKDPKSMIQPILLQIIAWGFDILALFVVFAALGSLITPDKIIITNTIVVNLQSQGVALAGFTQIVSSTIYTILGITPILAITSTLLAGFAVFWFKIVVSFVYFQVTVFDRCIPYLSKKCSNVGSKEGSIKADLPISAAEQVQK